ncbi:MAG: hypothetical protein ACC656_01430 [Candidatus Heimdallarchaeota archaeon]
MKVYLKIISPKFQNSLSNKFIIEHDTSQIPFMTLIHKLKSHNSDLYHEISTDDTINSSYLCIVNNELILNDQKDSLYLNDGDKVVISIAIGGG